MRYNTNDFYQYLTLFKELEQRQTQQQSRGRKINAMDAYFYQMVELSCGRSWRCPSGNRSRKPADGCWVF